MGWEGAMAEQFLPQKVTQTAKDEVVFLIENKIVSLDFGGVA